jgi:hypothetical protein
MNDLASKEPLSGIAVQQKVAFPVFGDQLGGVAARVFLAIYLLGIAWRMLAIPWNPTGCLFPFLSVVMPGSLGALFRTRTFRLVCLGLGVLLG